MSWGQLGKARCAPRVMGKPGACGIGVVHVGRPVERSRVLDWSWQVLEAWGGVGSLDAGEDQDGRDSTDGGSVGWGGHCGLAGLPERIATDWLMGSSSLVVLEAEGGSSPRNGQNSLGVSWLVDASPLPPSRLEVSPVCVIKKTPVTTSGPTLPQYDLIFTLTSTHTLFPNQVMSTGTRALDLNLSLQETQSGLE